MPTNYLAEKIKPGVLPSIEYKEFVLDNGLKVILSKSGNIPMVAVNTMFHVGSKDEEENFTGLAHLFEHLMFEGSENIPKGQFDEMLSRFGGESNAYTSWDVTSYYTSIPSHHLEKALWMDSDRMNGFGITEESLEIQKDVVTEEKLLYVDNTPYGSLEEESSRRLFQKSGYRWPIIGNMDDLKKVTIKDIQDFFNKFYKPNNAVISVVGDIDYDETLRLIEKYYKDIKPGEEVSRKEYTENDIADEILDNINDNIQLEGKFLFYRVPKIGSKEYYAINILNGILSEGDSSRLCNELEYKDKLVNEIDSNLYGMESASLFCITAIAMKGKSLSKIGSRIDEILDDIRKGNISESELVKTKNKIETYYFSKRQSMISLSDQFSFLKTFYNDCRKMNYEIHNYLSVTREDIVECANRFLNNNQRVVLNYLPK